MTSLRHGCLVPQGALILTLAGLAVLISVAASIWLASPRPSDGPSLGEIMDDIRKATPTVDNTVEAVAWRTRQKLAAGRALREGRATFAETVARFRAIDAEVPPWPGGQPVDDETLYRVIFDYACYDLRGQPEELARVQRRLEILMEEHLAARRPRTGDPSAAVPPPPAPAPHP